MSSRFDLNNKYNYTKSLKLRNITKIKNIIVNKIDEKQEIKRLMAYITQTPLSKVGITYDNKKVQQPDITESLTQAGIQNMHECLIGYPFYNEMTSESYPMLFVHCDRATFDKYKNLAVYEYVVEVIVEYKQNKLKTPFMGERGNEVLVEIANLFDGYTLEGEESEGIGNISFSIGDFTGFRLSKSNDFIVYRMIIQTTVGATRVYDV